RPRPGAGRARGPRRPGDPRRRPPAAARRVHADPRAEQAPRGRLRDERSGGPARSARIHRRAPPAALPRWPPGLRDRGAAAADQRRRARPPPHPSQLRGGEDLRVPLRRPRRAAARPGPGAARGGRARGRAGPRGPRPGARPGRAGSDGRGDPPRGAQPHRAPDVLLPGLRAHRPGAYAHRAGPARRPRARTDPRAHRARARHPDGGGGDVMALVPSPVRIIGTGLIGGSLGLALRRAGVEVQVEDASPGTAALAVELGVGELPGPDAPDPALVLVAAPPDVAAMLVDRALRRWPDALVADVASVKATVLDGLRGLSRPEDLPRYIGAHPMAGRETSGVIAARADLFLGRPFVVVPHEGTDPRAVSALRGLATEIGSVPTTMDAAAHDLSVAHVSHVPQVMSSLVAATLLAPDEPALGLAGQGLRDTTRIADSDPRLWVEILGANAGAVGHVLGGVRDRLDEVMAALETLQGDPDPGTGSRRALADLIAAGNRGVRRIPGKHGGATDAFAVVVVLVPDRPGELARLLTEIGQIGVNLEDLRLEHELGREVGLAHIAIDAAREDLLTRELAERGWRVAEA